MTYSLEAMLPGDDRTDMQRRVLAMDWAATPIGAPSTWPNELRDAVAVMLNCRFPMMLMAGPDLTMIYNDGYVDVLGDRHPEALGRSVPEIWPEVWSDINDMVDTVLAGGTTFVEDLPLVMTRHGFEEETYFTFSYSPVCDAAGRVIAVLDTVIETTHRVLGIRRRAILQRLGSLPRTGFDSAGEACSVALEVLSSARADIPFAAAFLLPDGRDVAGPARIVASYGLAEGSLPANIQEWIRDVVASGASISVTDVAARWPHLALPGTTFGAADVDTVVLTPLTALGSHDVVGALLLGCSPHVQIDHDYRAFLDIVGRQVATAVTDAAAVASAQQRAATLAELSRARAEVISEVTVTLQRAVLGTTALPDGFAVHYYPAAGSAQVGGDWYDVIRLPDGGFGVMVGDVVGSGLDAAAVMGQLRSAGRALLLENRSPADVLTALDHFAASVPGARCATAFCGVIDPAAGTLRYSSAGHLPSVLADCTGAVFLDAATSVPLASFDGIDRPETLIAMPANATLLIYTDGLVERRGEIIDDGLARAVGALAEGRELPLEALAAFLTEQLLGDHPDDDAAFLLYRRFAAAPPFHSRSC